MLSLSRNILEKRLYVSRMLSLASFRIQPFCHGVTHSVWNKYCLTAFAEIHFLQHVRGSPGMVRAIIPPLLRLMRTGSFGLHAYASESICILSLKLPVQMQMPAGPIIRPILISTCAELLLCRYFLASVPERNAALVANIRWRVWVYKQMKVSDMVELPIGVGSQ